MEVYVTTPYLQGVKQSGSGIITTDYFESNVFDIAISGSGVIETAVDATTIDAAISGSGRLAISGDSRGASFDVSGSGRIDAYDLTIDDCKAFVSGSGNMWVSVNKYLKATISGSGNIFYTGQPQVESKISGSGNVIQEK